MDERRNWLVRLFAWLRRRTLPQVALVSAAICLLALTATLIFALGRTGTTTTNTDPSSQAALSSPTDTATTTATVQATAKPTAKPTLVAGTGKKATTGVVKVYVAKPPVQPTPPPNNTPTETPCPSPTAIPTATGGASPTNSPSGGTSTSTLFVSHSGLAMIRVLNCQPCGAVATPATTTNGDLIQQALKTAAQTYGLPPQLLYATAYQESQWDPNAQACDGGIGLMQIQNYNVTWLNQLSMGGCDGVTISSTNYDVYSAQGNAYLGAKYLRYLKCLYEYDSAGGGSVSSPHAGSSLYNYVNYTPSLPYPDLALNGKTLPDCGNGSGSSSGTATPTPQAGSCSLCQSLYDFNSNGPADTTYQDLGDPSGVNGHWSCPFDPAKGTSDFELLDLVVSAYNEGPGTLYQYGVTNISYVGSVEYWLTTQPWSAWV